MRMYRESEDGWNFEVDVEADRVIPGEFQFVTFAGSPSVSYVSGGFSGTRTYDTKEAVREKLLPLGFKEVEREPQRLDEIDDSIGISQEDSVWLATQLQPGVDFIQFGEQYLFTLSEEQWAEWLPKMKARNAK